MRGPRAEKAPDQKELGMTGYCLPADRSRANDEDPDLGVAGLPGALLQRHGARVLDPSAAATVPDWEQPRSTVYRARTLFVPTVPPIEQSLDAVNDVLAEVGMHLEVPSTKDKSGLPKIAALVPHKPKPGQPVLPVVIDAWVALQALRAAARPGHRLPLEVVEHISLEHILTGATLTGVPITDGGGITGSPITDGGGITGPGTTDSYLFAGGDARTPVKLYLDAPRRRSKEECEDLYGRRPVVAVLDTGARPHPWLGDVVKVPGTTPSVTVPPGAFLSVDGPIQQAILANGQLAVQAGDKHRRLIESAWDTPVAADPLVGELDTHTGHGTFIAGVVRQVVPDAEVLAIRVMHSDGIAYEGDLLEALKQIVTRVQGAQNGTSGMDEMVDVVSLSMGYFCESPTATAASANSPLCKVIQKLAGLGVAVVAAAGNSSVRRRFYPAAFTEVVTPVNGADPLFSVGARNPNGSNALFSNGGNWVTAWASGAEVVSTFPVDVNGSREPDLAMAQDPANPLPSGVPQGVLLEPGRDALDPDDYSAGFAVWSGTSFATPEVASQFVKCLLGGARGGGPLSLGLAGTLQAVNRMATAAQQLVSVGFWA
jgi:subtilisin family serine protease